MCAAAAPGERTGQGGAPARPRVGLVCSAKPAGGSPARAPRHGGPRPNARAQTPPPPRPPPPGGELGPKSHRTPSPPTVGAILGSGGLRSTELQSRLCSSSGPLGPSFPPLPAVLGQPRAAVQESDDPFPPTHPPHSEGGGRGWARISSATPQSLRRGEGLHDGVTAARLTPLPLGRRGRGPREPPHGDLSTDKDAVAGGPGGPFGSVCPEPREVRRQDAGSEMCQPPPRPGATQSFGKLLPLPCLVSTRASSLRAWVMMEPCSI